MTDTSVMVSFPKLGLELPVDNVAFSVGGFSVYWYGILFALGFAVGLWYFYTHSARFGIHPYDGIDIILWAVVGGMAGARLYYVAFEWEYYSQNLAKIFALREGGLAIYGGFIGAVVVGYIACRLKKLPLLPALDAGLPGLMIAQAIGRWGNFFNQEAFGGNTALPWGMISEKTANYLSIMQSTLAGQGMTVDPSMPVHPTFLYESLWNVAGFLFIVLVLNRKRRFDGEIALFYISWYGLGRAFIEGLRTDSLMWGSVRVSQALGAILFVAAGAALLILRKKRSAKPAAAAVDETAEVEAEAAPAAYIPYCQTEASRERMAKIDAQLAAEKEKRARKPAADTPAGDADTDNSISVGEDPTDTPEGEYPTGIIEEEPPKEEE